jgi:hypothetical protein
MPTQFRESRVIALAEGNIWVADMATTGVQELDSKDKPIRQIGSYGRAMTITLAAGPGLRPRRPLDR